jgi:uncharacterized Fe-S radical SAM superfamily protein PflX
VMAQYHPVWQVFIRDDNPLYLRMRRGITREEYDDVVALAKQYGLHRGFDGEEQC